MEYSRYSDDELENGEEGPEEGKASLKATLRKPVEMLVAALGGVSLSRAIASETELMRAVSTKMNSTKRLARSFGSLG